MNAFSSLGGPGLAVEAIAAKLSTGQLTGIDRSATAISAARSRNRSHVRAGKARLMTAPLAALDSSEQFDKAFAVNVIVSEPPALAASLVRPAGR